jgi:hypothetical protein
VKEIFMMPPGRLGVTTMKTIEEVLRSKAGQMGATRKEIPTRLERLSEMGMFKRQTITRGNRPVETGELVLDHPLVIALVDGLQRPEAPSRPERAPRAPRSRRVLPEGEQAVEGEPTAEAEEAPVAEPQGEAQPAATEPEGGATPFRWVSGGQAATDQQPELQAAAEVAEGGETAKPKRVTRKPAARKTPAKPRTTRSKTKPPPEEAAAALDALPESPGEEPLPQ